MTRTEWLQMRAALCNAAKRLERMASQWPDGHVPKLRLKGMAKDVRQFADIADQWATNLRKQPSTTSGSEP